MNQNININKTNIYLGELIFTLWEILKDYGRYANRNTMLDLSKLIALQELESEATMYWGLREDGAKMSKTNDFGYWERTTLKRYKISWSKDSKWSIESCEKPQ